MASGSKKQWESIHLLAMVCLPVTWPDSARRKGPLLLACSILFVPVPASGAMREVRDWGAHGGNTRRIELVWHFRDALTGEMLLLQEQAQIRNVALVVHKAD